MSRIIDDRKYADGRPKWRSPMPNGIEFQHRELPVDPYLLGILLGDGHFSNGSVMLSTPDREIIERVSKLVPDGMILSRSSKYDYRITGGRAMRDSSGRHNNVLTNQLREIGVYDLRSYEKFIPDQYLYSSREQRISLLHGLMDSDGYLNGSGSVAFSSASSALASGVSDIVRSLGGIAFTREKNTWYTYKGEKKTGRTSHYVGMSLPRSIQPFSLKRKLALYRPKSTRKQTRFVDSVDYVGEYESVCIMLDSENQWYVTSDYVVTHNTSLGGTMVRKEAARIKAAGLDDKLYAAHISWEQPVEELEAMYQLAGYSITEMAWGNVPVEEVIAGSLKRPGLPVWLFGDSIYSTNLNTPPMTIEYVYDAITAIDKEWHMRPSFLFFDYIQDIPVPDERDRYMQVSSAMRKVKRLATQVPCPIALGVQANQRTDDYAEPIPTMRDTEWASVIAQKADTIIALWRPIRTWLPIHKPSITIGGIERKNDDLLFVIKLLKQRFGKGYGIWSVQFDMDKLEISDYPPMKVYDLSL